MKIVVMFVIVRGGVGGYDSVGFWTIGLVVRVILKDVVDLTKAKDTWKY